MQKLKLYTLNKNVVNWIKSFLCYRKQRVKLNSFYSEWAEDLSGIPQGTILGPILFIIYINDLPDLCQQFVEIYLFADDAKLYKHISEDDQVSLQMGLDVLQDRDVIKTRESETKTRQAETKTKTKTRQAETETKTREAEAETKTKTKTSRVETKTKTSKKWS